MDISGLINHGNIGVCNDATDKEKYMDLSGLLHPISPMRGGLRLRWLPVNFGTELVGAGPLETKDRCI